MLPLLGLALAGSAIWYIMGGSSHITDPNDPRLSVRDSDAKTTHQWRTYEVVGTNAEGTEILIQAEWRIDDKKKEVESYKVMQDGVEVDAYRVVSIATEEIEPTPDEWKFRVAQKNQAGITTPISGKSKGYAMTVFGNNESTQSINPNQWGVPYDEALLSANAKLQIGTMTPQGGFEPLDPSIPSGQTGDTASSTDPINNLDMSSFTGYPINGDSLDITDVSTVSTGASDLLTDDSVFLL